MSTIDPQILNVIVAGAISLSVSIIVTVWNQRAKLKSDYDSALRLERLVEYKKLWALTETLGWYGNHTLDESTAQKLLCDLDHWYFENGSGLLMSNKSIDSYEELLFALHSFKGNADTLRKLGTKLRYALAHDVGGRNAPLIRKRNYKNNTSETVLISKSKV